MAGGAVRILPAEENDMTEDATLYRVRWEIEIEAETPLAGVEKARHYQTKPGTTATVFKVAEIHPYAVRRFGDPLTIDLSDDSLLSPYPCGAARAPGPLRRGIPPRWRNR
jgi:hypothetical protein